MVERKDVTVKVGHIDARAQAYSVFGTNKTPRFPNIQIDPAAQALATEIIINNTEQCLNPDGSLNVEGFKQALADRLRGGVKIG
jgi:hypothetical protein